MNISHINQVKIPGGKVVSFPSGLNPTARMRKILCEMFDPRYFGRRGYFKDCRLEVAASRDHLIWKNEKPDIEYAGFDCASGSARLQDILKEQIGVATKLWQIPIRSPSLSTLHVILEICSKIDANIFEGTPVVAKVVGGRLFVDVSPYRGYPLVLRALTPYLRYESEPVADIGGCHLSWFQEDEGQAYLLVGAINTPLRHLFSKKTERIMLTSLLAEFLAGVPTGRYFVEGVYLTLDGLQGLQFQIKRNTGSKIEDLLNHSQYRWNGVVGFRIKFPDSGKVLMELCQKYPVDEVRQLIKR